MRRLVAEVSFWLVWGGVWLLSILPAWFLYHVLLDVIYFLVYKVARYRVRVVRENLTNSFPDKSKEELRTIERKFYYHLSEIFIDTIDMVSISKKQLKKRMVFEGIEQHEAEVEGKNWIAALAHYGSWEYFSAYQLFTKTEVVGVYHRLHSKIFERFYTKMRERFLTPVRMQGVLRFMVERRRRPEGNYALGLISDQQPRRDHANPHWHWFLNQRSAFYNGIEELAVRFELPVYYMHVTKVRRAHYIARFELIYDGVESVESGEVTERYVRRLETNIMEAPQCWMWSHRRWKERENMPDEMTFPHPTKQSGEKNKGGGE